MRYNCIFIPLYKYLHIHEFHLSRIIITRAIFAAPVFVTLYIYTIIFGLRLVRERCLSRKRERETQVLPIHIAFRRQVTDTYIGTLEGPAIVRCWAIKPLLIAGIWRTALAFLAPPARRRLTLKTPGLIWNRADLSRAIQNRLAAWASIIGPSFPFLSIPITTLASAGPVF